MVPLATSNRLTCSEPLTSNKQRFQFSLLHGFPHSQTDFCCIAPLSLAFRSLGRLVAQPEETAPRAGQVWMSRGRPHSYLDVWTAVTRTCVCACVRLYALVWRKAACESCARGQRAWILSRWATIRPQCWRYADDISMRSVLLIASQPVCRAWASRHGDPGRPSQGAPTEGLL